MRRNPGGRGKSSSARAAIGLLGVVHLPPLPGAPRARAMAEVRKSALADARALAQGGVDGLIVENFGDVPFHRGDARDPVPPHVTAALALIGRLLAEETGLPVGINCLRNDARAALGAAAAAELSFIRVNVHVGAMVTDQGILEGDAARTLRYRQELGSDVKILADLLVKHAAPLAAHAVEDLARDTVERGLADAVIVTGPATGAPVDRARLQAVRRAVSVPVLVGSGLDAHNARDLWPLCDGAIVGTAFKRKGDVRQPVDVARVRRIVARCRSAS